MVLKTSSKENTCFGRSEPAGLGEEQRSQLRPTLKTFSAPQNLLRHFEVFVVSGVALVLLAAFSDGFLVLFVTVTVFAEFQFTVLIRVGLLMLGVVELVLLVWLAEVELVLVVLIDTVVVLSRWSTWSVGVRRRGPRV